MTQPTVTATSPHRPVASRAYTGYVLFMIFLVMVFNSLDRTIVSVLVDDIRADLGLNDRQIGFILGFAFVLVHFIATIPFARLADRWSRPRIMAIGLFSWSVMTALCGMAQNFLQLALARMGVGVGEAAGGPPGQAMIAEYVPPEKRGKAMSLVTVGGLTGLALGVLYGGWASENLGWRFALVSAGVAGMLLAVLFWFTVADRRSHSPAAAADQQLVSTLRQLSRDRVYVLLVLGACAVCTGSYGRVLWEPTFLRRVYDMSAAEAGGWFFMISSAPSALGAVVAGMLIDRLSHRDPRWYAWVPAISSLLAIPLALLFYLSPPSATLFGVMPTAFIYSIAISLLGAAWVPCTMCVAQARAPAGQMAVAAAIWGMASSFIGFGVGPLLVGDLSARLEPLYGDRSISFALAATTIATAMGALFYARLAHHLRGRSVFATTQPAPA